MREIERERESERAREREREREREIARARERERERERERQRSVAVLAQAIWRESRHGDGLLRCIACDGSQQYGGDAMQRRRFGLARKGCEGFACRVGRAAAEAGFVLDAAG